MKHRRGFPGSVSRFGAAELQRPSGTSLVGWTIVPTDDEGIMTDAVVFSGMIRLQWGATSAASIRKTRPRHLEAIDENAFRFYRKYGFTPSVDRPDHLVPPVDDVRPAG
jgi:hypothetical protein